ncbi:MAG TPA: cold shock domain-containing protein [Candidatus Paceibacterota bacterium]|nr:cold shock domain-containing protein [Candidatus Paceibacterota bacterium]
MQKGQIVRIMDKGYGFIKHEGSEKDLFFHSNELQNAQFDDLKGGENVEFEIAEGKKGPQAVKVSLVK